MRLSSRPAGWPSPPTSRLDPLLDPDSAGLAGRPRRELTASAKPPRSDCRPCCCESLRGSEIQAGTALSSGVAGPELDDIGHQAAADAPWWQSPPRSAGSAGESRFTTWAYKFVIFEVSTKIGRHFWRNPSVVMNAEEWDRLTDSSACSPPGSRSGKTWWPPCIGRWTRC